MPRKRKIDPTEINLKLLRFHRDAMLELILAWGSLDGALGMLLSDVLGLPLDKAAEQIGKLPGTAKLLEVKRALQKVPGAKKAAQNVGRYKKAYEKHSKIRNRIAHSHCVGFWTCDDSFVVFTPFESAGNGEMILEAISVERMRSATKWGREFKSLIMKIGNTAPKET